MLRSFIRRSSLCPWPGFAGLGLMWALLASFAAAETPRYLISHLAGSDGGAGQRDGTGTGARFRSPGALARDGAGNLYVADVGNHTIRKIDSSGVVTTLAGEPGQSGSTDGRGRTARFNSPAGIAVDNTGNVFVADQGNRTIRKITPAGDVTTLAGTAGQSGATDGTGVAARFTTLSALAVDSAGTLYAIDEDNNFATQRHNVRKITISGTVTTLTATNSTGGPVAFRNLLTLCVDAAGDLYVCDTSAQLSNNAFYRISPAGVATVITPPVGNSSLWGTITASAIDAAGNLYVAYPYSDGKIFRIAPGGAVSIPVSKLYSAGGIAVDPAGNLFVTRGDENTVVRVATTGEITPVAGLAAESGYRNGAGPEARFTSPVGATLDASGNLYVADSNGAVRKITPAGTVSTFAGAPGAPFVLGVPVDGTGTDARFGFIAGLAADAAGNLWVAESLNCLVRRISPGAVVTTVAGSPGGFGLVDGTGAAARFDYVNSIAVDLQGNAYTTGLSTVHKITPAGVVTTLAGSAEREGSADGTGAQARFFQPSGLAVDAAGNVFVSDSYNHTIRKITPAGVVTTVAGAARVPGYADGPGAAARFSYPGSLAFDPAGNLLVADPGNGVIRRLAPDGTVSTVAGKQGIFGADDGLDLNARFDSPSALAIAPDGTLYVTEYSNHAIRKGSPGTMPVITAQPQGLNVVPGTAVQLSVTAAGTPSPSYQWHFNGAPFQGATGSTLSFANARASDAGDYTVIVTNTLGSVTSAKATLAVTAAPVSPPPASAGGSGGGAPSPWFLLVLAGLRLLRYRFRRRAADGD